ncbi:hypothetical protein BJ322DRAFT_1112814 [Thelephora terrestris]|uniref:Uncharacterized protein n=1 Tax=Thelephora terrestris TaxID=56493 RepID=A0A9P6H698_9AGAM|nr:hypothetical protein BJ322DRAFT_1112814 [Thelephora terrestris]
MASVRLQTVGGSSASSPRFQFQHHRGRSRFPDTRSTPHRCLKRPDLDGPKFKDAFKGNFIDLGMEIPSDHFALRMYPRDDGKATFKCLTIACLLVNGNATSVTIGRATGIFSLVRDDDTAEESMEWATYNYDKKSGVFSAPGDSGSIIVDGLGRTGPSHWRYWQDGDNDIADAGEPSRFICVYDFFSSPIFTLRYWIAASVRLSLQNRKGRDLRAKKDLAAVRNGSITKACAVARGNCR